MQKMIAVLKKDPVLFISGLLAAASMFLILPDGEYFSYIDFRVLALLFCLMCVMNGFQEIGLFAKAAVRILGFVRNTRQLSGVLVFLCFFFSMLITNDVALITFVPFTVLILRLTGRKDLLIPVIVLQTVAANLGSMLTPIGNPQNLYLYSLSGMSFGSFLATMLPYTLLSFLLLFLALFFLKSEPILANMILPPKPSSQKGLFPLYLLLFLLCLGCVLRILPWPFLLACTLAGLLWKNRSLIAKADFGLLATFVFFFIFIGNMGRLPAVAQLLGSALSGRELPLSVLACQVISNVPAAILLSGFTQDYTALLIGVNIGGLGTLIASLASLISYKQYAQTEGAAKGAYLLIFTGVNLLFLLLLLAAAFLLAR